MLTIKKIKFCLKEQICKRVTAFIFFLKKKADPVSFNLTKNLKEVKLVKTTI